MKILYLSTPSFADCDFPLIKEFQCKGLDVTYLILLPPFALKSTLFDIKKQIPKTGIFAATKYQELRTYEKYMDMSKVYVANRTGQSGYSFSYLKYKYDLYRFLKKERFDIIHCDTLLSEDMKFMFGMTKKWIQTIHDPFPHTGEVSKRKIKAYHNTITNANLLVLLNNNQKQKFCEYNNLPLNKVIINRLGVYDNIRMFVHEKQTQEKNNILFFGRISPYKGVEYLCEAMKKVRKHIPDATLTIAGGGKIYFDIGPYKQLGCIEVKNQYIGMEELASLLNKSSLTVCPYTDATQSGVIMTSYSLGKPVVATNVGGLPEMIENDRTGKIVPPKDNEALADAIIDLLSNKNKLEQMSNYILEQYYKGKKSWAHIADCYIESYHNILKQENLLTQ